MLRLAVAVHQVDADVQRLWQQPELQVHIYEPFDEYTAHSNVYFCLRREATFTGSIRAEGPDVAYSTRPSDPLILLSAVKLRESVQCLLAFEGVVDGMCDIIEIL